MYMNLFTFLKLLVFLVDSETMLIQLPGKKLKSVEKEASQLQAVKKASTSWLADWGAFRNNPRSAAGHLFITQLCRGQSIVYFET